MACAVLLAQLWLTALLTEVEGATDFPVLQKHLEDANQDAVHSERQLMVWINDLQAGIVQVLSTDGSCEQSGMLSIRDRESCQVAVRALGLGTRAEGHAESQWHAGSEGNANVHKGCMAYYHATWVLYYYFFNDIPDGENTTYFEYFPEYLTPICLSAPPRTTCQAGQSCKEGTEIESGGECTPDCPAGFQPDVAHLFCAFGKLSPPNYTCVPSWEPVNESACNSSTGCLSRTVRGTPCQRWDVDRPHGFANDDNASLPAHNFCGTPDLGLGYGPRLSDLPWCFTTDPAMQWDFCLDETCIEGPWKDRSARVQTGNSHSAWTCRDYVSRKLCTLDGDYGPGWQTQETDRSRYGKFSDYRFMGLTAIDACCGCGGGNRNPGACEDNPHFRDDVGNCRVRAVHRVGCDDDWVRWYCPRACGLCSVPAEPAHVLLERCEDDRYNQLSCDLYAEPASDSQCSDDSLVTELRKGLGAQAPEKFDRDVLHLLRDLCPFSCQRCEKCDVGYRLDLNYRSYEPEICQECPPGTYQLTQSTTCLECAPGRFTDEPKSRICRKCPKGSVSEEGATRCTACPSGRVPNREKSSCRPCEAGFKSDEEGTDCVPCRSGTFAPEPGSPGCTRCPPGWYSASSKSLRCTECEPGRASFQNGSEACEWCPRGNYSDVYGSSVCQSCVNGTTTDGRGSSSADECVCGDGTCFDMQSLECTPCPQGMRCAAGCNYSNFGTDGAHPMLQKGYMTLQDGDPLRVFACSSSIPCPGGLPGSCAEGHDTEAVACGRCVDGYSPQGQGCQRCADGDTLPFVFVMCLAVILVVLVTLAINKDPVIRSNASIMVAILGGMAVSCLQSLNVFRQLEIHWFEPMRTILDMMSVLSFDLDLLNGGCVFGHIEVRKYVLQQCAIPLFLPVVLFTLVCKKRFVSTEVRIQFCNTVGTLFQVGFISLVINCVMPLRCYDHPTSGSSVSSMPSILCFVEGDHTPLLLAGLVSFLAMPCPFLAVSIWATWVYPTRLLDKSPKGRSFVLSAQFLFSRFNPTAHYYCIVTLAKNCILACVPVIFQRGVAFQSCLLGVAIVLFMMHQQQVHPWKSYMANQMDGFCSAALLVLLLCGTLSSPADANIIHDLQIVGTVIVSIMGVFLFGGLGYSIYRMCVPGKLYKWFICHHKADASAQARLLKMLLQARSSHANVFIDSDNLIDLDTLFNVVKVQVETLVVYMTRDILTRPWCVGEIVTAFRSGAVQVVKVKTSSYAVPPMEKLRDLEYLQTYLDMRGCNLSRYYIRMEDVRDAFINLLKPSTPCVEFNAAVVGTPRFDRLADDLASLSAQKLKGPSDSISRKEEDGQPEETDDAADLVVISSEPGNDEATAAVSILCAKMNAGVVVCGTSCLCLVDMGRNQFRMANCVARCRALVVILSFGSLSSILQLHAIVELMLQLDRLEGASKTKPAIIPVNLPEFQFPQAAYYENQLPLVWGDGDLEMAAEKIKSFFRFITIGLPIHASDLLIETQCHEVLKRIPEETLASHAIYREPLLKDLAGIKASARSHLLHKLGDNSPKAFAMQDSSTSALQQLLAEESPSSDVTCHDDVKVELTMAAVIDLSDRTRVRL